MVNIMYRYRQRASQTLRERLLTPLHQLSGLEVIVAVSAGVVGGLFPIPLVTSLVTLIVGWYLRCSAAELVIGSTVNFFCTPLQFILLPSFARLMGSISQEDTSAFTASALKSAMTKGYVSFLSSCGKMVAYATMAWFLVFIPVVLVLRAAQQCATQRKLRKESLLQEKMEVVYVSEES